MPQFEIEIDGACPAAEIQDKLDAFRESVLPCDNYGITLTRASAPELPVELVESPSGWATGDTESEVGDAH